MAKIGSYTCFENTGGKPVSFREPYLNDTKDYAELKHCAPHLLNSTTLVDIRIRMSPTTF